MFNGWLSFAGTEILNEERTRTYVGEMLPTIQMPTLCRDESRNLAGLLDDEPYRTPLLDDAPWVDPDDPDTLGFLGVYPLSVSGLTDDTSTATVLQNTLEGGAIVGQRRGTKEVRVTALLMATSEASLSAGKRWLSSALGGGCDPCSPGELCFLVGTPGPDDRPVGEYVDTVLPSTSLLSSSAVYQSGSGTFKPTTTAQDVHTPRMSKPLPCDEIRWHWTISSATVGTTIILEAMGETGVVDSRAIAVPAAGGTYTITDRGIPSKFSYSRLRVTSAPGEQVVVPSVRMEYRSDPAEDACFTKYGRQLREVKRIGGPVTIREYEPSVGAMEQVEFSFAAQKAYVYGFEREVLSVEGATIKRNVRSADVFQLDKTVPACSVRKPAALVKDPDCPPVPTPPKANVTVTSCGPEPEFHASYALAIPDSVIPLWADVVPILSIRTGTAAARKVQVRFMPRPFETQAPVDLDPCSACGSFVIDYIPPHTTFVLNGMEERAYVKQPGNRVSDGGHLLSGMTSDTLFEWPILTCGTGYLAIIDTTTTGVAGFDLSVAVRE